MKKELIRLLLHLQANPQLQDCIGHIEFNGIHQPEDFDKLSDEELLDIGGNIVIDYNDANGGAELDKKGWDDLWNDYIKPIDEAYCQARPNDSLPLQEDCFEH